MQPEKTFSLVAQLEDIHSGPLSSSPLRSKNKVLGIRGKLTGSKVSLSIKHRALDSKYNCTWLSSRVNGLI